MEIVLVGAEEGRGKRGRVKAAAAGKRVEEELGEAAGVGVGVAMAKEELCDAAAGVAECGEATGVVVVVVAKEELYKAAGGGAERGDCIALHDEPALRPGAPPIWPPARARNPRPRHMDPASSSVVAELWRPPPQHHHGHLASGGTHHEAASVVTAADRGNGSRSGGGGGSSRRRPRRDVPEEEPSSKLASTSGATAADSVRLALLPPLALRIGCDPCRRVGLVVL
ncbi:hypothetical protein HU200_061451 [Digitaria exilis]|uniref:Uncharacterized protein n=1 Tax=Digitaria exilis TaxID=1010633 RepID=A0A835A8H3_9POAL|nr:hypothetical protein HU200_061451 [Digitaria exilis]